MLIMPPLDHAHHSSGFAYSSIIQIILFFSIVIWELNAAVGRLKNIRYFKEAIVLTKRIALFAFCVALLLSACSALPSSDSDTPKTSAQDVQAQSFRGVLTRQIIGPLDSGFVQGVNDFGFSSASRLFAADENLAISPASIELALGMALTGANGATKDEMIAALGLEGLTDDEITAACKSLMWRANTGGMEAANAIWLLDDYQYNANYVNTCTEDFMADLMPLAIPGAMEAVNAWASEKTHGRIAQMLEQEPNADTRMIITNALYYLGEWELPFEAHNTFDGDFAAPGGSAAVRFMNSEWSVPYYQNDEFSMISLRFKSKADEGYYAMAFLLPAEGSSLKALLQSMDGEAFQAALQNAKEQEVWIRLPKFEIEYFSALNDTLGAMGIQKAFSMGEADFFGITDQERLFISSVLHKCFVRVDELGAEAAAATVVEMMAGGALIEDLPPQFYADRPFLFAIYSLEDGAIAFLGAVNNPTK
jgi:serpin B